MRRITRIDKRRDDRQADRIADLESRVAAAETDKDREMWLHHLERAKSIRRSDRVFPLGVWLYSAFFVAWFGPSALLARGLGNSAGIAYLIAYPLVMAALWGLARHRRSGINGST